VGLEGFHSLLLQAEFLPLVEEFGYTSYKAQLFSRGGSLCALGHSTQQCRQAACLKDDSTSLAYEVRRIGGKQAIHVELPYCELGCHRLPKSTLFCARFGVYLHHYANIYHEYSASPDGYRLSLVDVVDG